MFTFNLKDGTKHNMTTEELTRWMCLVEAIDSIDKKCQEQGKNMDDVDWIKPLAIQKYIDERYHAMLHDIQVEHERGVI